MEKYALEKLKGCKRVCQILETMKDDINVYIRTEAFLGGELWEIAHTFG